MAAHALARHFKWDALERVSWSAVEFTAGAVIVAVTPLDAWWAVPIAVVLAAVKASAAKRIGQPGTASTLPASKDPAATAPATGGVVNLPPVP
jgi:hypothetical protein